MDAFWIVAEGKIREAYENGEFDNLPGTGKPLVLEDLSAIPPELRMGYKMLKNAGMLEETNLKNELMTIEDLIDRCQDDVELAKLKQKMNEKTLRLNSLMKKRKTSNSSVFKNYQNQVMEKFK